MNDGRLLIKHAVGGRTFVDTAVQYVPFAVEQWEGEWRLSVQIAQSEPLTEILKWKDELNVFIFEEERTPVRKNWFYVKSVNYDDTAKTLRIAAASRLDYIPDEYTW